MVWTGNGGLVGSGDDFIRELSVKYNVELNPGTDDLEKIAEYNQAQAAAELAGRGVAPTAAGGDRDGNTVSVLLISPSSLLPTKATVREASWGQDMDGSSGRPLPPSADSFLVPQHTCSGAPRLLF